MMKKGQTAVVSPRDPGSTLDRMRDNNTWTDPPPPRPPPPPPPADDSSSMGDVDVTTPLRTTSEGQVDHVTYYALGFCGMYGMLMVVIGTVLPISEFITEDVVQPHVDSLLAFLCIAGCVWLAAVFLSRCKAGRCPQESSTDDFNMFLKCGLVGFGILSVLQSAIDVAIFAEYQAIPGCYHVSLTSFIRPLGWMFFCLMQMYILLTFQLSEQPHGWQSWFYVLGLMHCVATNLCVWVNTVVHETVEALEHRLNQTVVAEEGHEQAVSRLLQHMDSGNASSEHECPKVYLQELKQMMSPLLFPCTVEESLIAAAAFAITLIQIKSHALGKTVPRRHKTVSPSPSGFFCMSSCKGLIAGVVVLVAMISVVAVFAFSLHGPGLDHVATSLAYQIVVFSIHILCIVCTVCAWYYLRQHRSDQKRKAMLDKVLLTVSMAGVLFLGVLGLIAGVMAELHTWADQLLAWRSAILIIEAALQTLFVFDGLNRTPWARQGNKHELAPIVVSVGEDQKINQSQNVNGDKDDPGLPSDQSVTDSETHGGSRDSTNIRAIDCSAFMSTVYTTCASQNSREAAHDSQHVELFGTTREGVRRRASTEDGRLAKKRSRQLVMFLFVLNVTLWLVAVSTLYVPDTYNIQEQFYDSVAWILLNHISLPLLIFFRFHSAACLFEIWVHAYRLHSDL
ncbi:OTOP1 [Branchiostoma lanceolatum]|uniref:OTOP1 protein n=2 Tax=Branchiostoma lanceolatum TaxID=7740 RepID=A0A8K0A092_BRALA|nr:OTOP1 [Branchiostoma lanceolatum]